MGQFITTNNTYWRTINFIASTCESRIEITVQIGTIFLIEVDFLVVGTAISFSLVFLPSSPSSFSPHSPCFLFLMTNLSILSLWTQYCLIHLHLLSSGNELHRCSLRNVSKRNQHISWRKLITYWTTGNYEQRKISSRIGVTIAYYFNDKLIIDVSSIKTSMQKGHLFKKIITVQLNTSLY